MTNTETTHISRRSSHRVRRTQNRCDRTPDQTSPDLGGSDGQVETPLLMSIPDAAAMLSLGRTTIYALITSGELEAVSIGRARRVPLAAVLEFVEQRSVAAARYGRS